MEYHYKPAILAKLAGHGICPRPGSPPELVRGFVNDLYCYELRRLRDQLLSGAFPKHAYAARVVALRDKYSVLALKPLQFVE